MSEAEYEVVFEGELVDGADLDQVKANVAKLFKTDVAKVEPLFSGKSATVKSGLDEATARKYRTAFRRAGAVVSILDPIGMELPDDDPPEPAPPPPRPGAAPAAAPAPAATAQAGETGGDEEEDDGPSRLEIAEAARAAPPLVERGTPSVPDDMSMADAGAVLVDEPSNVQPPDIDTSHLSLSEAGVDLVEHQRVEEPEFDLSEFELAPPGTALGNDG